VFISALHLISVMIHLFGVAATPRDLQCTERYLVGGGGGGGWGGGGGGGGSEIKSF
jgi:hypothetical protein